MTGRRARQFFRVLPNGDAVRVRITTERGRVLAFTAQLEVWVEGTYRPAERYDSAHGQAHRDTLDWEGRVIDKLWLAPGMSFEEALTLAERDLRTYALHYRAEFLRRRPRP